MTTDTIIITALASELDANLLPKGVQVFYSGIGKLNAAIATFKAIADSRPQRILNFGTVGAVAPCANGLIEIQRVVQRDMIAEPLAPRGQVPFCTRPHEYLSGSGQYTCGTGDSFVMAKDPWFEANNVDVVDMELFAIAAIAHDHNIAWRSFKYVTDHTNEDSGQDWQNKVRHGEHLFIDLLKEVL
jgi:adenosylhomocysteine nucleosidase